MSTNLLIVESPNKIKKIKSFLATYKLPFEVTASCGHIRNLDPKEMSIEIENNFKPIYINSPDKKKIISQLKQESKKAITVWLAMDYDREGEAIAWHIKEVLKLDDSKIKRITFTQITKSAIIEAIENPGVIDMNMFYAQQARMILDKLIGYKVSPILWKQYNNWKLSAGRVQSVVVKIINEREEEIKGFKSSNFFKVSGTFWIDEKSQKSLKGADAILQTELDGDITSRDDLDTLLSYVPITKTLTNTQEATTFKISSIKTSNTKRRPPPPFTTSSLQQEASNKLGMSPKTTMMSAQLLYENGLITYMRTDSLTLCNDAHTQIKDVVCKKYGENYYNKIHYKTKSANSQEAHEAIRPTKLSKEGITVSGKLTPRENRLYQLIWRRTVGSQMKAADVEITSIKVALDNKNLTSKKAYVFSGKFEKILFSGYLKVYNKPSASTAEDTSSSDSEGDADDSKGKSPSTSRTASAATTTSKNVPESILKQIKKLKVGDTVYICDMDCLEKNTKPPHMRYTEANLIKKLDELGIGRPSTYAGMIDKVQTKGYVEKKTIPAVKGDFVNIKLSFPSKVQETVKKISVDGEKNKLFINPVGYMIDKYLNEHFTNILDYKFTANVETLLDKIAKGEAVWVDVVKDVYNSFNPTVDKLMISFKEASKKNRENKKNKGDDDDGSSSYNNDKYQVRELGTHPSHNVPVIVMNTKYGPAVCLNYEEKEKRQYANFTGELDCMTLESALKLLEYPKVIGTHNGHQVYLNKRKNYYLTCNKKHYSLDTYNKSNPDNPIEPTTITLNECQVIIGEVEKQLESDIKINKDIVIKKGPYGFYIKHKNTTNVKIPAAIKKKYDNNYKDITLEECQTIVDEYKPSSKGAYTKGKYRKK